MAFYYNREILVNLVKAQCFRWAMLLKYRAYEAPHRKIQDDQRPPCQIGIAKRQRIKQYQPVPPKFANKTQHRNPHMDHALSDIRLVGAAASSMKIRYMCDDMINELIFNPHRAYGTGVPQ